MHSSEKLIRIWIRIRNPTLPDSKFLVNKILKKYGTYSESEVTAITTNMH
jgi:hypothetical protein